MALDKRREREDVCGCCQDFPYCVWDCRGHIRCIPERKTIPTGVDYPASSGWTCDVCGSRTMFSPSALPCLREGKSPPKGWWFGGQTDATRTRHPLDSRVLHRGRLHLGLSLSRAHTVKLSVGSRGPPILLKACTLRTSERKSGLESPLLPLPQT